MSKEELLKLLEELPDSGREKLALIAQGMLIAQSSKENELKRDREQKVNRRVKI